MDVRAGVEEAPRGGLSVSVGGLPRGGLNGCMGVPAAPAQVPRGACGVAEGAEGGATTAARPLQPLFALRLLPGHRVEAVTTLRMKMLSPFT